MIKDKIKTTKVKTRKVESYICDKCKKVFDIEDYLEIQEFHMISFIGGYGSVFGDGSEVSCEICQYCLKDMIKDIVRILD